MGPVALEATIRYRRELLAGDEADVSCVFIRGGGKVFTVGQTITKTDGTVAAGITAVGGLLDLERHRLVPNPRRVFRGLTNDPGLFGL